MFYSRVISNSKYAKNVCTNLRLFNNEAFQPAMTGPGKYVNEQIDFIRSLPVNQKHDWAKVRDNVLSIPGSINDKNVDSVIMKSLVNHQKLDLALAFGEHLRSKSNELSLGSINGLLNLYYTVGISDSISSKDKAFILETYSHLYDTYKILDYSTCERLLHALCVIDEWEKCLKVLENLHMSSVPSHSAYSTLIATLFKNNKQGEAMRMINESLQYQRPLQTQAYSSWADYVFRKYKTKKARSNHCEAICEHIASNFVTIEEDTAIRLKDTFNSLGWNAQFSRIRRQDGECVYCKQKLALLKLDDEEFELLQQNVKDKLIVGSDLFLKTSPDEMNRFQEFIERTAPYEVVLDALNIAFAGQTAHKWSRMEALIHVVEHFKKENKKMLLLGRKHMLAWPKRQMQYLMDNTCSFFTDNLSQDDPFFITAAIVSGPHTDVVSKDLLRGHRFALRDERQRRLFRRWQWQHQWLLFKGRGGINLQPPLSFTPVAQRVGVSWHMPFRRAGADDAGQVADGVPDWSSWLCMQPARR